MKNTFDFLENHLNTSGKYVCGDNLTIADILLFHETTNVEMVKFDIKPWKNIQAWYERVSENKGINEVYKMFTESLPRIWELLGKVQME